MGQLERYGLYVLVLVIFLILGVAIWGGEPQAGNRDGAKFNPETYLSTKPGQDGRTERVGTRSEGFEDLFSNLVDLPAVSFREPEIDSAPAFDSEDLQALESTELPGATLAAPEYRTYTIREFDTGGSIAKRELGRAGAWQQIEALNPGLDSKRLKIGQEIKLPAAGAMSGVVDPGQQRRHTVLPGEYLGSISQKYYNTARYADLIGEANNITDPRKIRAGKVLIIPAHPDK